MTTSNHIDQFNNSGVYMNNDPGTGTGGTGGDPGTGGEPGGGWYDYVPWDIIGSNLNGFFAWLGGQNAPDPYYNQYPQTDHTRTILYGAGAFLLVVLLMIFFIKVSK